MQEGFSRHAAATQPLRCHRRDRCWCDRYPHPVEQIAPDDPDFFAATKRQALHRWRFRPSIRDGGAAESWKTLAVPFRIHAG